MVTNPYVNRIVQATGITPDQAFQALAAVFQGLIDTAFQGSVNTINITPTPNSGNQVFITVNNPPHTGGGGAGGGMARTTNTLIAYISGRAGISLDDARTVLKVALQEIDSIGQAAIG